LDKVLEPDIVGAGTNTFTAAKVSNACVTPESFQHDVDKVVLFDGKTREPTEWLRKLPHAAYSMYLVLKAGLPLDIAHIVLSHTAFSLKRQKTVEALILHMADHLIAALRNFKEGVDFLWSAEVPRYTELPDVE